MVTRWHVGLAVLVATVVAGSVLAAGASAGSKAGDPFKIMIITGINTTVNNAPELPDGATAAADAVNKAGGFGGRPVQIVGCSHQSSSTGAAACAQKAVDEKFDWVLENSAFASGSDPILLNAGIPYAGSIGQTGADYKDPNRYPILAPAAGSTPAACYTATKSSKTGKTFVYVSADIAAAAAARNLCRLAVLHAGGKFFEVSSPNTVTDFSPVVLKVQQLHPNLIGFGLSIAPNIALIKSMQQFGLNLPYVMTGSIATEGTYAAIGLPVNILVSAQLPSPNAKLPGMTRFKADMAAANLTGDLKTSSQLAEYGWAWVWALKKMSDTVKGSLTKETLLAQIKQTKSISVFGLFRWMPTTKGPAIVPNQGYGGFYLSKFNASGELVPFAVKPVDIYALAGIGKTPGFATLNPASGK